MYNLSKDNIKLAGDYITIEIDNMPYCIVESQRADDFCKKLSAKMKDVRIKIVIWARIKAIYLNGQRIKENDYSQFYILPEESLNRTKLHDSSTGGTF